MNIQNEQTTASNKPIAHMAADVNTQAPVLWKNVCDSSSALALDAAT